MIYCTTYVSVCVCVNTQVWTPICQVSNSVPSSWQIERYDSVVM